jgi:cytochrome c peroxidase
LTVEQPGYLPAGFPANSAFCSMTINQQKIYRVRIFFCALTALVLSASESLAQEANSNAFNLQPLPAPVQTPNVVPLSPAEQLGKDIFFDHTLSNPEGYSCATCHTPQSGFTGPSSEVNAIAGPLPGVVPGRFGRRKPQSIPYAAFCPEGPYLSGGEGGTYVGGNFWDGRAPDTTAQARMPFLDQNEMANTPVGPYPPHAGGYSPLVAKKLRHRPYTQLFQEVYGRDVFKKYTDEDLYALMTAALARYEASAEVNQFSSKYDASTNGTPPMNLYTFTQSEENGRQLFFGKAQCFQCHSDVSLDSVTQATQGKETFTMYCYANIGVPKNPENPFYLNTNCDSNPAGCNSLGDDFIDHGLGANPNPAPDGTLFYNETPGDLVEFNGLFKAPSLRNVDKRPYPGFVKSYMHNGVFKSLEEVVHFYNKRSVATNSDGVETEFNWIQGPPDGFTPIFPSPEVLHNVQNVSGYSPAEASEYQPPAAQIASASDATNGDPDLDNSIIINGQVGNLQLTDQEEADLVSFLKTLTDGFIRPNAVAVPEPAPSLTGLTSPPGSGSLEIKLAGQIGQFYVLQTSTNLTDWVPVSTHLLTSSYGNITNRLIPGAPWQFWRAVSGHKLIQPTY